MKREALAAWSRKMAGQIESYVQSLLADSAYALGGLIPKRGTNFCAFHFSLGFFVGLGAATS